MYGCRVRIIEGGQVDGVGTRLSMLPEDEEEHATAEYGMEHALR